MASSEDYLDKLLKDMMGGSDPEPKEDPFKSEIPQNVDSMGLVIDRAPSLSPAEEAPLDSEIADLMADIMPSFDAGLKSVSEDLTISSIDDSNNYSSQKVFTDIDSNKEEDEEPASDIVVPEEPVIEEPVIEEPTIDEPVIEEPSLDDLVIEEPVIEEPVIDEAPAGESQPEQVGADLGDIGDLGGLSDLGGLGDLGDLGDIQIPGMEDILGEATAS